MMMLVVLCVVLQYLHVEKRRSLISGACQIHRVRHKYPVSYVPLS